eukprot:TRINITY_DN2382_c0_g1_i1.p1 TRINITY_DN2382_c0_g1~~TRINITY_DN2382_c0_g1_i1.p1  ORF type:complete len:478 (-),score=83.94 TRINITY_DN2382_c0_g1_i1:77-1489(-)
MATIHLAAVAAKQGQLTQAIELYTRALNREEGNAARVHWCRALCYEGTGQIELALRDYQYALHLEPNASVVYLSRAMLHESQARIQDALADYTRAAEIEHDSPVAYFCRAHAYQRTGNNEQAIGDLTKALEVDPKYAKALNSRGAINKAKGDLHAALADFTAALSICKEAEQPKEEDDDDEFHDERMSRYISPSVVYFNRGVCQQQLGDAAAAEEDFNNALEYDPQYAAAYLNRGACREQLNRLKEAVSDYSQATRLQPKSSSAYFNRGRCLQRVGMLEAAVGDFSKYIELVPKSAAGYECRAECYIALKNAAKAQEDIATARSLGGNPPAVPASTQSSNSATTAVPTVPGISAAKLAGSSSSSSSSVASSPRLTTNDAGPVSPQPAAPLPRTTPGRKSSPGERQEQQPTFVPSPEEHFAAAAVTQQETQPSPAQPVTALPAASATPVARPQQPKPTQQAQQGDGNCSIQ